MSKPFTPVSSSSFVFEFDVNPVNTGWGTYPNLILKDENDSVDSVNVRDWDLYFEVHWDDHNYNEFMLVVPQGNTIKRLTDSPTFQTNTWYQNVIEYDVNTSTLIWTVTERDSGAIFHAAALTGVTFNSFNQLVAGHHGVAPHYGNGHWATTLFDNIKLSINDQPDFFDGFDDGVFTDKWNYTYDGNADTTESGG